MSVEVAVDPADDPHKRLAQPLCLRTHYCGHCLQEAGVVQNQLLEVAAVACDIADQP